MIKQITLLLIIILVFSTSVFAVEISFDDFESDSFSGGTGWTGDWTNTANCILTSLSSPIGNYHLRGYNKCDITRNFDTSSNTNVVLSFYATASSLENADHCRYYYYDGSIYTELLTLNNGDDDGDLKYYEFNITGNANSQVRMFADGSTGDYCYLDNVAVNGDDAAPVLNILTSLTYPINEQNKKIDFSASLTNTDVTIELYLPDDTLFCSDSIISPSVAYTEFSTYCDFPNQVYTNAYAYMYVTGNELYNKTKYFNIVEKENNPSFLDILKVYYSKQVLQGGSTEVFALLNTNLTIDTAFIELTFPDESKREFSMAPTMNTNEYRAFITDTYQTGNITFNLRIDAGNYYDTYSNNYIVAPYNVDFVSLVNQVSEVLNVKQVEDVLENSINVFGTEYRAGEMGTVFLQLFDEYELPVNNGSCQLTIYYPDENKTKYYDSINMDFLENGLYYEDIAIPYDQGIYMMSVFCYYNELDYGTSTINEDVIYDGNIKDNTNPSSITVENSDCISFFTEDGNYQEFRFVESFISNINVSDITTIDLNWIGQNEKDGTRLQAWDFTNTQWDNVGATFTKSKSTNLDCHKSHGISRSITSNFADYIDTTNSEFRFRIYYNDDKKLITDDVNIKFHTTGSYISDIRGSGEIHVNDWFNNYTNLISEAVWTWEPDRNLTYYDTVNVSIGNESFDGIAEKVWSWNGIISDNIFTNFIDRVWNYTGGRYTHGDIVD